MGISETIFIFAWLYKIKATHAVVAQLVERRLPKPQVASSSLVYRSFENQVVILNKLPDFLFFKSPFLWFYLLSDET